MRVAIIAPPFITVPPRKYGGTELFIAQLAEGLAKRGVDVVVYTNGESTVRCEKRWLYPKAQWPIKGEVYDNLKDINHTAWALADASGDCDIFHLNNAAGLAHSRLMQQPFVYTVHHKYEPDLSGFYQYFPDVNFVTISDFQRMRERVSKITTIHHGIEVSHYELRHDKREYLSFLGRICGLKGTHIAIEVAKRSGIPLKIAGEIQPIYRDYFEKEIKPHIDGRFIEYVGEANHAAKNELLSHSLALLFPIQWNEPFGLVMIEAMACGAPVLAFGAGSVPEVVRPGVSGAICSTAEEMALCAQQLPGAFKPASVRAYVEKNFSVDVMVARYAALYRDATGETSTSVADVSGPRLIA